MRRLDLTPLMRSSVGFDHLNRLLDTALTADAAPSYPPYNIEKLGEDDYLISMAVAGFSPSELTVTAEGGTLLVAGRGELEEEERTYLHKGIAKRAFERRFELAETVQVGAAKLENGLLEIALKRVIPEHKKPRTIEISTGTGRAKTIEATAA